MQTPTNHDRRTLSARPSRPVRDGLSDGRRSSSAHETASATEPVVAIYLPGGRLEGVTPLHRPGPKNPTSLPTRAPKGRKRRRISLEKATLSIAFALASALEHHNAASGTHARRTQVLAGEMALALGLGPEGIRTARCAALLHDIGKMYIPEGILDKPGELDPHEREIMELHPRIGANMLSGIAGFERVRAAILAHHEYYDGRGYPAGLRGEEIPVGARLISVVDTYDAMTNDRPYRRALSQREAVERLEEAAGGQFDLLMVQTVKEVLKRIEVTTQSIGDRRVLSAAG